MKHIEQELINIVKDFYDGDDATFNRDLASLDSYYGILGEDRWERMEELNEYYRDCEPIEILERAFLQKVLNRIPEFIQHIYLMTIVILGWVIFSQPNFLSFILLSNFIFKLFFSAKYLDVPIALYESLE